ncbi:MAG: FHA domain-containing protein [Chloroflexota bacterium]
MDDERKQETGFLNAPDSQPMQDRLPRPQTTYLGAGWKLQVKVGEQSATMDVEETMVIGRSLEGEDDPLLALDLGPFDAYRSGVSRRHAIITQREGGLYIEDAGSTNGTRINGFQLSPRRRYRLRDGDEVEFARLRTVFRFVAPSANG